MSRLLSVSLQGQVLLQEGWQQQQQPPTTTTSSSSSNRLPLLRELVVPRGWQRKTAARMMHH
jgi:hypothetical protein